MELQRERLEKHGYRFDLGVVVSEAVNAEETEAKAIAQGEVDVDDLDIDEDPETATTRRHASRDPEELYGFDEQSEVWTIAADLYDQELPVAEDADTDVKRAPMPAVKLFYQGEFLRTFVNPDAEAALDAAVRYAVDHLADGGRRLDYSDKLDT